MTKHAHATVCTHSGHARRWVHVLLTCAILLLKLRYQLGRHKRDLRTLRRVIQTHHVILNLHERSGN